MKRKLLAFTLTTVAALMLPVMSSQASPVTPKLAKAIHIDGVTAKAGVTVVGFRRGFSRGFHRRSFGFRRGFRSRRFGIHRRSFFKRPGFGLRKRHLGRGFYKKRFKHHKF